jgi:tetratricopeptide (TPR) repeat protein
MADRLVIALLFALAVATLVAHVVGALFYVDQWWGVHFYAFFPSAALLVASVVLGLAIGATPVAAVSLERWLERVPDPDAGGWPRRVAVRIGLAAAAAALFWWLRCRHLIWGDGNPLTKSLVHGEWFHPDSPLSMALHQLAYRAFGGWFAPHVPEAVDAAQLSAALGSALAGGAFAVVAWGLAGELARAGRASRASDAKPAGGKAPPGAGARAGSPRGATHGASLRWLLFLLILSQGYAQLFFGYVENYTYVALAIALYAWLALRALRGASPLWAAGLAMLLAQGFHLLAVFVVPSFLVLVVAGLMRRGERRRTLVSVLAVAVAGRALKLALSALAGYSYDPGRQIATLARIASTGEGDRTPLFSAVHLRDVFNEQALIGPLGLFLFLGAAVLWLALGRRGSRSGALFALLLALPVAAASWVTRDLRLGYARDWDLFAPGGVALTVAGLWFLVATAERRRTLVIACALGLAASLYHTAPWVALNRSFPRSLERLKALPLGGGRTGSTVAYWYAQVGDFERAQRWLDVSLRENPAHISARLLRADIAMTEGRWDDAASAFEAAARLRPSFASYRLRQAQALARGEHPEEALVVLDEVPQAADPRVLALRGILMWGLGRAEEARATLASAAAAEPRFATLAAKLEVPGGYDRVVAKDLDDLIGLAP